MKNNIHQIGKVKSILARALEGVDHYLRDWEQQPLKFTTEEELLKIKYFLLQLKESVNNKTDITCIGFYRMTETWPCKDNVRYLIISAEYEYEKLLGQ